VVGGGGGAYGIMDWSDKEVMDLNFPY